MFGVLEGVMALETLYQQGQENKGLGRRYLGNAEDPGGGALVA